LAGVSFSQNEGVVHEGGPGVADGVLHVNDVLSSVVLLTGNNNANTASVTAAGCHGEVADFELGEILEGSGGKVELDNVVNLDVGVRIANSATVVCDDEGDSLGAESDLADTAELELGLLGVDLVEGETALGIIEQTENFVRSIDLYYVHESRREAGVCADLLVDFHQTLHEDEGNFLLGQGILKSVSQHENEREALSGLVGTSGGLGGPHSAHLVEHPGLRGVQTLKVLLRSARLRKYKQDRTS